MFDNIIFDFGQVIIHFNPIYMTSVYSKDSAECEMLSKIIFDRIYWDRLDDGSISDSEVKRLIKERLPAALHKTAEQVYDNWYYNTPLVNGIKELISELKAQGKKLYLLSNISCGFAENYQTVPKVNEVLALFDGLVFSGPLGLVKPQQEIFEHLLNKYSLDRHRCIFIDDSEKNLNGAAKAGITGYLFDGDTEKLKKELIK